MKERLNLKTIVTVLPVLGLILLLLLSPCKVRNYIQAELGIPQTEVSNKSKTTINETNCNTFEAFQNDFSSSKKPIQHLPYLAVNNLIFSLITNGFNKKSFYYLKRRNHSVSPIPLYILYQNLKVYL